MLARPLSLLVILAATAAVYAPELGHPFLFDDVVKIVGNPKLEEPLRFFAAFSSPGHSEDTGRLVTNLTFALDYALYGWEPFGYHLTQLLWHLANVWLVAVFGAALLRRTGAPDSFVPLFGAAIFGLHPLLSEAVLYDNARPNVVTTTFYLLAVLALLRADEAAMPRRRAWLAAFAVALVLALFAKELAVTAVVMAPLAVLWSRGPEANAPAWRRPLALAIPLILAGLVASLLTGAGPRALDTLLTRPADGGARSVLYLGATLLEQSEIFLRYLGPALAPWPGLLNVDHSALGHLHDRLWPASGGAAALSASLVLPVASSLVVCAALWLCVAWRHRAPVATLLALWPFVTHAPTSLLPRAEVMVEYRAYLPMVGVSLLCAWALDRLLRRLVARGAERAPTRAFAVVAVFVCAALAGATSVRARAWGSAEKLWADSVAKAPRNPRALTNLGLALGDRGANDEAERRFRDAIAVDPAYTKAHNNLGNLLLEVGRGDEALAVFRTGLEHTPDFAVLHSNLGRALVRQGSLDEAIGHHERAHELAPDSAAILVNLATALAAAGRAHEAVAHFERALALHPDAVITHVDLAHTLAGLGRTIEAAKHYRRALELAPEEASVHTSLGALLAEQGDPAAALAHLERAVTLAPESADAHSNLAALLARQRRYGEAIRSYRRALELQPDHSAATGGLAAAVELDAAGTAQGGSQ